MTALNKAEIAVILGERVFVRISATEDALFVSDAPRRIEHRCVAQPARRDERLPERCIRPGEVEGMAGRAFFEANWRRPAPVRLRSGLY